MLDVLEKFNKKYEGRFIGDMQQYIIHLLSQRKLATVEGKSMPER
jgi:hypothetical protein